MITLRRTVTLLLTNLILIRIAINFLTFIDRKRKTCNVRAQVHVLVTAPVLPRCRIEESSDSSPFTSGILTPPRNLNASNVLA